MYKGYGDVKPCEKSIDLGFISARLEEIIPGDATIPSLGFKVFEESGASFFGKKIKTRVSVNLLTDLYKSIKDRLNDATFDQKYAMAALIPL